jgi:hypothetical protein
MATQLGRLTGTWTGSNGFRLMPDHELEDAPASAAVTTAAGGHAFLLTYEWVHPDDGPQDGILLAGSPDEGETQVTVAWGDSWHQKPPLRVMTGTLDETRLRVEADYGGGWVWVITIDGTEDRLSLTMENVIPAEYATADKAAGPYPVMVGRFRRRPQP